MELVRVSKIVSNVGELLAGYAECSRPSGSTGGEDDGCGVEFHIRTRTCGNMQCEAIVVMADSLDPVKGAYVEPERIDDATKVGQVVFAARLLLSGVRQRAACDRDAIRRRKESGRGRELVPDRRPDRSGIHDYGRVARASESGGCFQANGAGAENDGWKTTHGWTG